MATLATFEGDTTENLLDRLFVCNDVLGVMVYGPDGWNKVKNFVCNEASKQIAMARGNFGKWPTTFKRKYRDALDDVFGFNDELGAALLGGESWGHLRNRCKTAAPVLGKSSWTSFFNPVEVLFPFTNPQKFVTDPVKWTMTQALPASSSPSDIAKWVIGYQQTAGGINAALDIVGINSAKERAAIHDEIIKQQKEEEQRIAAEAQAAREHEDYLALADAQQKLAEAQATSAVMQKEIQTSPIYQESKSKNILLVGGLGLLALMVVFNNRK